MSFFGIRNQCWLRSWHLVARENDSSWTLVSFPVCFWNASKVLIIFSKNTLFPVFIINVVPNPVQAEKSHLSWLLLIVERALASWNLFLTEYFEIKQKKLYKEKIILSCISECIFEFEWAAVFQALLDQEPAIIPSTTSKNSTFCVSSRWWNFLAAYRQLFLCRSWALFCFITTTPYYSWELWALPSPPGENWTFYSPWIWEPNHKHWYLAFKKI